MSGSLDTSGSASLMQRRILDLREQWELTTSRRNEVRICLIGLERANHDIYGKMRGILEKKC